MTKLFRILLGSVLAALMLVPLLASADVPVVSLAFSVTTATTTNWLALSGQSQCSITYTSVGGGSTATVQGAADSVPTPQTVTGIGTTGVITNPSANAAFGGPIAPYALKFIRLSFSSVTSGTIAGTITCSGAVGGTATISGTVSVTCPAPGCDVNASQASTPWLVYPFQTPWPVRIDEVNPAASPLPVSLASPKAASGAIQTTPCDLTTNARCATVTASNALKVDGSAVTQPISVAAPFASFYFDVASGATSKKLLSFSGATTIKIYGVAFGLTDSVATAEIDVVRLVYGTKASTECDTGTTTYLKLSTVLAPAQITLNPAGGILFTVPASSDLCLIQTGTNASSAITLWYTQS